MDRVKFIHHKNIHILYMDFSGCTIEEAFKIIEQAKEVIASQQKDSVLTLTNVTDAHYDNKVVEALKSFVLNNKPYVKKGVVVGIKKLQRVIYDTVMKFAKRQLLIFDDIEKAKDWLVDRRQFLRIQEKVKVEYSVVGGHNLDGTSQTIDISLGGTCFFIDKQIERNTLLALKIYLPEADSPIQIKGEAIWAKPSSDPKSKSFMLGVQFRTMSNTDRQNLFNYIFARVGTD